MEKVVPEIDAVSDDVAELEARENMIPQRQGRSDEVQSDPEGLTYIPNIRNPDTTPEPLEGIETTTF